MTQTQMALQPIKLSEVEKEYLLKWWEVMESAQPIVQKICSLSSHLRSHPNSSHVDGMILYYRSVSELAYGHAGTKGGIRRAYNGFFNHEVEKNIVMCVGGYRQFSEETRVLLENVSNHVKDTEASQIIKQLRSYLEQNDDKVKQALSKGKEFFGAEQFQRIQMEIMNDMTI